MDLLSRARPVRTLAIVVGLVLVAAAQLAPSEAAGRATGFAHASAQAFSIDPKAGGLSFGVTFGIASAGQENTVAKAYARSISLGLFGVAIGAPNACTGEPSFYPPENQPQPVRADSREPDAAAGRTKTENGFTETARATTDPRGESSTTIDGWSIPGLVKVGPTRTTGTSGTGRDGKRFATATSDVADLDLVGGLVHLTGLHWDVTYRDEATPVHTGGFAVAATSIAGVPVPVLGTALVFELANAVLGTVGVLITPPEVREAPSALYIDPLQIAVVPNATRDSTVGRVLVEGGAVREPLFDALLAIDRCTFDFSAVATVFDLFLNSLTGAGAFQLQFGGVEAGTRPPAVPFAFGGGGRPLVPPAAGPAAPATPAAAPVAAAPEVVAPARVERDVPLVRSLRRRRDGAVAVALVTLAVGAALVFLDRRRMTR